MKKYVVLAMCTCMTFVTGVAFAAEVATTAIAQSAASRFFQSAIEIIAYGAVAVLTLLAARLIRAIERKFNVDIPDEWELELTRLIDKGINYAEEQGRKQLKIVGEKLRMNESLELAANFVLDIGESRELDKLGKEKLKKLIESRLGLIREELPDAQDVVPNSATNEPESTPVVSKSVPLVAKPAKLNTPVTP